MLSRLYLYMKRFLGGSGRFDPSPAAKRIPKTALRAITARDHNSCVSIYKDNEARFFPGGYLQEFQQDLSSNTYLWLGAEEQGELIALGGIRLGAEDAATASLAFGMVHPDKHGLGYGSALLLARIASLPPPAPVTRVFISTLKNSVGFFKRFGFVFVRRVLMDDGIQLDWYYTRVTHSSWEAARALLISRQVTFDPDAVLVPNNPFPD